PLIDQLSPHWNLPLRWPTEREWEYACRAATTSRYHGGEAECVPLVAWCAYGDPGQRSLKTKPVAHFVPNAWGLYDMHGNLWEWLSTRRQGGILTAGGCFRAIPQRCTATARMVCRDGQLRDIVGGRLAFDWSPEELPIPCE
ncbi:MAG: SUMF1/EgtB/PvdO family nonheme iron enzyme, partial [Gemmataceae bacterium]